MLACQCDFSWQAQYSVMCLCDFSCANGDVAVRFCEIATGVRNSVFFNLLRLQSRTGKLRKRRVQDDEFIAPTTVGSCSDRRR